MAGFRVTEFKGLIPLVNHRKLANGHAVIAENCDLEGTDLRVYNQRKMVGVVSNNNTVQRTGFVFSGSQMFVWNADVDATYGPIQHETVNDNKIYIGSGWFPYPVYTTKTLGIPGNPDASYFGPPINQRKLGVPPPEVPALVAADALDFGQITEVVGNDITLEDGVTVATDAVICTCAAPHGLKTGDRVRLEQFDWDGLNNTFIVDMVWNNLAGYLTKFVLRGVSYDTLSGAEDLTAFPSPGAGTWTRDYADSDLEDRVYIYTYVTDQGEEGPPSAPSLLITIGPDQGVTLTLPTSPVVDDVLLSFIRIYRTLPTSRGAADYYFVAQIDVTAGTYYDIKKEIELGEIIPSMEWVAPPEGLVGFTNLPNGVIAGFKGNALYMCEPYQPHAWPESYIKRMDNPIVGIAAFGQSLVVATSENPYVGTLTDPLSMTFQKMQTVEPCLSKRACISLGYGVMFPSPNGLILVTPEGARNVLKGLWREEEWLDLILGASEVFASIHNEKYFLTVKTGSTSVGYVFDPAHEPLQITKLGSANYSGSVVDRDEDRLFFFGQQSGPRVFEFDPDDGSQGILPAEWESQTFVMPMPVNMGACQAFYDTADSGPLTVKFYADGVLKHTQSVTSQEPFRLPSGFLAREWKININTERRVQEIYVTETISELRGAFSRGS
jgi:hypothetical protein